jgi:probable HAF family extracellular repeat protein
MSFRVRNLLAPLVIILAVQNLEAQTWGQHGVTVHLLRTHTSPFDIHGLHAVNNLGQVVGVTYDGVSVHSTGVFTPGAGVTYLSAAANQSLIGLAINDAGQIAGYTFSASAGQMAQAVLYDGGVLQSAGPAGAVWSYGQDLNATGQVAGYGTNATQTQAFGPGSSGAGFIGTLTLGSHSVGHGINDNGDVAGYFSGSHGTSAVVYSGGVTQDLGNLGGTISLATDINNAGQAVGYSYLAGNQAYHAFVANGGTMTDLGTLGGLYSYAFSIDASGRAVGAVSDPAGNQLGVLWESTNGVYSGFALDQLVNDGVSNVGWSFIDTRGISDNGRFIVAYGNNVAQGYGGYVLLEANTPASVTPEPVTFALLGTGLLGLLAVRRRKKKTEANL